MKPMDILSQPWVRIGNNLNNLVCFKIEASRRIIDVEHIQMARYLLLMRHYHHTIVEHTKSQKVMSVIKG